MTTIIGFREIEGLNLEMKNRHPLNIGHNALKPAYRRLRGYAFDPSFSTKLDSSGINILVYPIRWEVLQPGPIGEYLEVIDVDPSSSVFYPPVDLDDPQLLAQDGLFPSESNPQFHQQMVYAVGMLTIQHFEKALGRRVQWSSRDPEKTNGKEVSTSERFVERLRLYPHAFRGANAYYSSLKKSILFGYFSARPSDRSLVMPGSLVFSCLSHDIVAHEVTHALIDGIHKRYVLPIHEDTLAVHEAFSDIVALFQHFTFPDILENQIARTRGNLAGNHWLSQLAQQFGWAIGRYNSLRNAITFGADGKLTVPNPQALADVQEPHARGSILVAAMFHAFLSIYERGTADLFRIATEGRGVLPEGEIHPDLVRQLAAYAARVARHFLSIFIRALDYCPPVGTTFGELLRAMITADVDLVSDDTLNYRIALIDSFKRWGIYPEGIYTLSVQSLTHSSFNVAQLRELGNALHENTDEKAWKEEIDASISQLTKFLRDFFNETALLLESREALFDRSKHFKKVLELEIPTLGPAGLRLLQNLTGILFIVADYEEFRTLSIKAINQALSLRRNAHSDVLEVTDVSIDLDEDKQPTFEVHSINRAQRVGPEANVLNQVILTLMQRCSVSVIVKDTTEPAEVYEFRGGTTIILDIDKNIIRVIYKGIMRRFHNEISSSRLVDELLRRYTANLSEGESPFAPANWPKDMSNYEPFAMLHRHA
ncbi:hypothetical protein SAMN00120144_4118 [Hymenobacter roseosalivarius DSM 11622]|uniref:Peptidase M4 n=1 Tax=Hymenobacter roseosalivarius DSM 11622 TaxID=645990 RepID=A0A1W1UEU3_9BACT|nr:hypothetical protein [Hymenobacter roseosalivarius]SMB79569.1 hypothetical protein SAMN00120144_4118 [Hymenobacter roseosalivarius DSM 11622]